MKPTKAKPAGAHISIASLGRILRSRYYLGYVTLNGTEYRGRHEPLISQELFDRVQEILDGQRGGGTRARVHHHYLKGTLWCHRCRRRLMIMRGKGKKGDLYFYYICRGRQNHTCDLPYVPVAAAEDAVERYYATVALPADLRARVAEAMDNAMAEENVTSSGRRDQLKKQLAKLDTQEDQFLDLVGDPDWPKDKISARLRRIRDERARLQRQLDQTERPDLDTGRAALQQLLDLLAQPQQLYRLASGQARRVLNQAIFTRLHLDADDHGPRVATDEPTAPFAPLIHAYRAVQHNGGDAAHQGNGTAADDDHWRTTVLASAMRGECSSNADVVDVIDADPVEELLDQCVAVARQVLARPGTLLADLDLVTDKVKAVLPDPRTASAAPVATARVSTAVHRTVARAPERTAVVGPTIELTYRDLWAHARRVADQVRAEGAGPGDAVELRVTRDPLLPAVILGCWQVGAAVALLDDALPAARQSECHALLRPRLVMSAGAEAPPMPGENPLPRRDDLSHVLFTSGTTGTPKAIAVPHGPLHAFLTWYSAEFGIGADDRFALVAGPGHDPVLRDMFAPLVSGATLYVPPAEVMRDPGLLRRWLGECRITVLHATPALLELILGAGDGAPWSPDGLRLLVIVGAPLTTELARAAARNTSSGDRQRVRDDRDATGGHVPSGERGRPASSTPRRCAHPVESRRARPRRHGHERVGAAGGDR